MNFSAIAQMLVLLAIANGAPVVAKRIMGHRMAWPVDGGAVFYDGVRILGPSKTLRGLVVSVAATAVGAALMGLPWMEGALIAASAMIGDLFSSFVKRRMNVTPSDQLLGVDQIPEALLPVLQATGVMRLTIWDVAAIVAFFFVGELVASRVLYVLKIRDQPY